MIQARQGQHNMTLVSFQIQTVIKYRQSTPDNSKFKIYSASNLPTKEYLSNLGR